ncbi:phage tail protein [Paenibacillus sp. M1]|uniref:Phage tail protein n=1 Tax=Paenibacillus haidiansis TaxID=1574488 RepID=A0ABU7VYE7_9BACL
MYNRTVWKDHIVSPTGEIVQQGTPISAANLNNIEEGIAQLNVDLQNVKVPPASLDEAGIVQLSSATDSDAEDKAATPKAIKDAALKAKSYTDQQINLVTETGIPKLVSYPLKVTATTDNQAVFEIPLDLFDSNTDTLMVSINRAILDPSQYTITNTVRNAAGEVTQRAKITLLSGVASSSELSMVVLKNVPIGPDGAINGAVLAVDSVPLNRVNGLQEQLDEVFQAGNERKTEVVAALVAKGISASISESWDSLISKMSAIIKATGNATAAQVRAGATFSNASANGLTGSLPVRATAAQTITPGTSDKVLQAGIFDGAITIKGDANLVPGNIKDGAEIFGVAGNSIEGKRSATGTAIPYNSEISVRSLSFSPSVVVYYYIPDLYGFLARRNGFTTDFGAVTAGANSYNQITGTFYADGFKIRTPNVPTGKQVQWLAIE